MSLRLARVAAFVLLAAGCSATFARLGECRALRPQYELRRLGPALQLPSLGEQVKEAEQLFELPPTRSGEIEPNSDFDQGSYSLLLGNPPDKVTRYRIEHRTILWIVLIATMGFLAMLTLRLVRQGSRTSGDNSPSKASSEQNQ